MIAARLISLVLLLVLAGCGAERQSAISFSNQGAARRGEQQVFPVGIYTGIEARWIDSRPEFVDRLLDDLSNSPFDFVVNYGSTDGTIAQQTRLFNLMAARGIRDFASVKDLYPELALSSKGPFAGRDQDQIVRETVGAHRNNRAVVGWYISDEPEGDATPILLQHQRVKAADPSRPTLMVSHQSRPEQLKSWIDTADILAVDPYPIPRRPVTFAADVMRSMKSLAGDKPVWFVLQAFGGYQYEESIREKPVTPPTEIVQRKRPPTIREMRCLTYSAIAEGADGIIVYYHKDLIEGVDADRAWPAVKTLATELRSLSPILVAPSVAIDGSRSSQDIRLIAKSAPEGLCLIIANTSPQTQSVVVRLESRPSSVSPRSGNCFYFVNDQQLLLILDGLESVLVNIR